MAKFTSYDAQISEINKYSDRIHLATNDFKVNAKTGRRAVIDYFLGPLQRHVHESFRER